LSFLVKTLIKRKMQKDDTGKKRFSERKNRLYYAEEKKNIRIRAPKIPTSLKPLFTKP